MNVKDDLSGNSTWQIIRRLLSGMLWLIISAAAVWAMWRMRSIVLSVLAAGLLTYVLLPGVEWLSKRKVKRLKPRTQRLFATVIVFSLFLALAALAAHLFISPFSSELSAFINSLGEYAQHFGRFMETAGTWYTNAVPDNVKSVIGKIDYSSIATSVADYMQRALKMATSSVGIALELILIPVLAFYFLLDYRTISREFYGVFSPSRRKHVMRIGRLVGEVLQSYIFGQIILCVIAGVLTGVFLSVLGMPYIVVLALFSGVTRAIPVVGPVVSGIPIVLVGLMNSPSLVIPVYLLVFVIVMHFVESKFIMPHLIGERLHLHPAVVIIVLLIGAEFFGLVGMFLAAPVAAVIREVVRFYYIKPACRTERSQTSMERDLTPISQ